MRLVIIGNSKSGKTTAAKLLADYLNCSWQDCSSVIIGKFAQANRIPIEEIVTNKDKYRTILWEFGRRGQAIDPLYAIPSTNIVVGVRNKDEIEAIKKRDLADLIIWINKCDTSPGPTDCVSPHDADIVINNNGTLEELKEELIKAVDQYR